MALISNIDIPHHDLARLCHEAGVVRVWLFGSALTGTMEADSDIDLLVETDRRNPPGLFKLGGLQMELTERLGHPVHLTLLGGLPPHEQARLTRSARLLDAA